MRRCALPTLSCGKPKGDGIKSRVDMNIIEKVRQRILKFLRLEHLADNPNGERYTYIQDAGNVNRYDMEEARVWYLGSSSELLNFYLNKQVSGHSEEPAYNRNNAEYYWSQSVGENHIKRVHSGIPRAIIDTLCNVIGTPLLSATDASGVKYDLTALLDGIGFQKTYMQEQLPLTMAIGWGAWKIDIPTSANKVSDWPIVRFYEARNCDFVVKDGITIGVIFKDYYQWQGKKYLLLETRRINERGNSAIEYELFRLSENNDVKEVPLDTVPELARLTDVEIPNFRHILAVPCRFFFDPNNPDYGRSIYYGKYDLFDDLDQSLSQRSQTCRVSTPVEYYAPDVLERGKDGKPFVQKMFNRQFVMKSGVPDADGKVDNSIQTTQPQLNFDQYTQEQMAILDMILTGVLSPATMGIDVAKKDNADAQREKEKVTIMTRNNVIDAETRILKELISLTMAMTDYMRTGSLDLDKSYQVSVKFSEFANPSFESLSQVLLPLWQAGAISDEMFVEKLYGDSLSKDEKEREIEAIRQNKQQDNLMMGGLENGNDLEKGAGAGTAGEGQLPEQGAQGGE